MTPPDDIKTDLPPVGEGAEGEDTEYPVPPAAPPRPKPREVGPESEVRGGAEAPDERI
jgi:hypothetical protein